MNNAELAQGIINRGRKIAHIKFDNVRQANARIVELETALGTPTSDPIFNIFRANARVEELEELLALKTIPPPAAPIAAPAPAAKPELKGRERFAAATKIRGSNNDKQIQAGLFGQNRFAAAVQLEGK